MNKYYYDINKLSEDCKSLFLLDVKRNHVKAEFENLETFVNQTINDILRKEAVLHEKARAKLINENDFIVGSPILKAKLDEILKGERVSYSPYVDNDVIIMISKAKLNDIELYPVQEENNHE